MIKNLGRKLAAAAAAFVLAAGAAGASANAQFPETGSFAAVLDIAPGTRQCITSTSMAYENASAANYVMAGPPLKFTFGSLAGGTGSSSGYPVFDYYVRIERGGIASFFGAKFPGYFRTCARNDGTEFSTVFLSITTDQ